MSHAFVRNCLLVAVVGLGPCLAATAYGQDDRSSRPSDPFAFPGDSSRAVLLPAHLQGDAAGELLGKLAEGAEGGYITRAARPALRLRAREQG